MFSEQGVHHYDAMYADKDYRGDVAWILARLKPLSPTSVLDVACGTGAHLAEFARCGLRVTGTDLSADMVQATRHRLAAAVPDRPARVEVQDLTELDLGERFDLVTCLFSSLAYAGSVPRLRRAILGLARHVRPGGAVVIEPFFAPDQWLASAVGHDVVQSEGQTIVRVVRSSTEALDSGGLLASLDFHTVVGQADSIEYWDESHRLLVAEPEAYMAPLRELDWTVEFDPAGLGARNAGRGIIVGYPGE